MLMRGIGFLSDVRARRVIASLMKAAEQHPGVKEIENELDEIRGELLMQQNEYGKAAKLLSKMHARAKLCIVSINEMEACLFAENQEALAALSSKAIDQILKGGPEYMDDGFEARAMRAAASVLSGDTKPLTALLEQAPRHPDVLARAWQATRHRADDMWNPINGVLEEQLPGLLSVLAEKPAVQRND
jgi:hypothetical protein